MDSEDSQVVAILGISGVIHSPQTALICTIAYKDGSIRETIIHCHETYVQAAQGLLEFVARTKMEVSDFKDYLH